MFQVNPLLKNQALFSSKDKSKKLKCLLQFLFGTLRVNLILPTYLHSCRHCQNKHTAFDYDKSMASKKKKKKKKKKEKKKKEKE